MSSHTNEMTMVEKVAAALRASTDKGFASWEEAARAAIEAMKSPSDGMVDAGLFVMPDRLEDTTLSSLRDFYTAAIDAALEENPK